MKAVKGRADFDRIPKPIVTVPTLKQRGVIHSLTAMSQPGDETSNGST
jgi:hypothetical protein